MADHQVGNVHGVTAKNTGNALTNKTNITGDNTSAQTGFNDTDLLTIAAMRSRLAAIDAGFYTADRLDAMTYNDMVYAIRVNDHAATVK